MYAQTLSARRLEEQRASSHVPTTLSKTHTWHQTNGLWIGCHQPGIGIDVESATRCISNRVEERLRHRWGGALTALELWVVLEAIYKVTASFGPLTRTSLDWWIQYPLDPLTLPMTLQHDARGASGLRAMGQAARTGSVGGKQVHQAVNWSVGYALGGWVLALAVPLMPNNNDDEESF